MKLLTLLITLICTFIAPSTLASGPSVEKTLTVNAPIEDVWHAWTTDEGARTFFSESTNIDLRPGGPYEIFFSNDAPEGQRGCEGCKVLAFDAPHMLSFTWNSPPKFGELRFHQTHVTIRLTEEGPDRTHVHFVHEGFGESEEWLEIRDYFIEAWGEHVLPRLAKSFEKKPELRTVPED